MKVKQTIMYFVFYFKSANKSTQGDLSVEHNFLDFLKYVKLQFFFLIWVNHEK